MNLCWMKDVFFGFQSGFEKGEFKIGTLRME